MLSPSAWRLDDAPTVPVGEPRWGLVDLWAWLVMAQLGSSLWAVFVIVSRHGDAPPEPLPISTLVLAAIALWACYGLGPWWSAAKRGNGLAADFGVRFERSDVPVGLAVGVVLQLAVLPALYWPLQRFTDLEVGASARRLIDEADTAAEVGMLFLLVVVAAPIVEELFYRGLALRSLSRRFGVWPAIIASSALFAAVHLQVVEFAGLLIFGVVAAVLAVHTGRLAASWAMHVGFNGTTLLVLLFT